MALPTTTSPKVRWGIPLVLPHVLLSAGLLVFAAVSEPQALSEVAPAAHAVSAAVVGHQMRRG